MDLNIVVLCGQLSNVRVEPANAERGARTVLEIYTSSNGDGTWTEAWTTVNAGLMSELINWNNETRVWLTGEVKTYNGETRIWADPKGIQIRQPDERGAA